VKITKTILKKMIKEELSTLSEKNLEESNGYIGEIPPQQALEALNRLFVSGKISVNDLANHLGRPMHGIDTDINALVLKDNIEVLKELSSALEKIRQDYVTNLSKTVELYSKVQNEINAKNHENSLKNNKGEQRRIAKEKAKMDRFRAIQGEYNE